MFFYPFELADESSWNIQMGPLPESVPYEGTIWSFLLF